MLRDRSFAKSASALVAAAAVALIVAGCAFPKPGSLTAGQPMGIGSVRVHFNLCTVSAESTICGPDSEVAPLQYLLAIAVPPGSTPPQSITATPVGGGGSLIDFTLNEEVGPEFAAASLATQALIDSIERPEEPEELEEYEELKRVIGSAWPPSGLQAVGYISAPTTESIGENAEWSVDADFGLPGGSTPYPGPFGAAIALGFRVVAPTAPASRPVHCVRLKNGVEPEPTDAFCSGTLQQVNVGTANLAIASSTKTTKAFVGGTAKIGFPLTYAGTAAAPPTFALSGTTTAKGAKVAKGSFTPGPTDPTTHVATGKGTAKVTLPKNIKPGTYQVTLTATTAQGGSVSQTAKLKVTKPTLKFGAAKPNAGNGTATLKVTVPGAGKLTIAGKGVKQVKKKTKKAGTLKVKIAATGKAAAALQKEGKAKLKLKGTFKPSSGISVSKSKGITLKLK